MTHPTQGQSIRLNRSENHRRLIRFHHKHQQRVDENATIGTSPYAHRIGAAVSFGYVGDGGGGVKMRFWDNRPYGPTQARSFFVLHNPAADHQVDGCGFSETKSKVKVVLLDQDYEN